MIKSNKKLKLYAFLLLIVSLLTMVFTPLTIFANSSGNVSIDITNSSVRDDLASMGEDKLGYLSETDNIFIGMAQRYDSSGKLRTYVYMNYVGSTEDALKISISTSTKDDKDNITESHSTYDLSYVNNESTWVKYEVIGLPNLDFTIRRYNISGISNGTTPLLSMNETYIFHGITNDSIEVFNQEVETITITEKEVRFFCYGEGSKWNEFWGNSGTLGDGKKYTDAWYVFFNTDKPMDTLKEIEITYLPYEYEISVINPVSMSYEATSEKIEDHILNYNDSNPWSIKYGEQNTVTITPGTTRVDASDNWWGGYKTAYQELDNIMDLREYEAQSTEDNPFVFSDQAEKYAWGVNFLNTEKTSTFNYKNIMGNTSTFVEVDGSGVCNTAIIRLKYEINGVVKNAYAIDVPTDDFAGSTVDIDISSIENVLEKLVSIILLLILAVVVANFIIPFALPLLKATVKGVGVIINLIFTVITLPFELLRKRK